MENDLSIAASWYGRAAQQGNASAQAALGLMYLSGQGADRDPTKAADWFASAAEQGNARAQYNLALLTLEGNGRVTRLRLKPCFAAPHGRVSSRRRCALRSCTRAA